MHTTHTTHIIHTHTHNARVSKHVHPLTTAHSSGRDHADASALRYTYIPVQVYGITKVDHLAIFFRDFHLFDCIPRARLEVLCLEDIAEAPSPKQLDLLVYRLEVRRRVCRERLLCVQTTHLRMLQQRQVSICPRVSSWTKSTAALFAWVPAREKHKYFADVKVS